MHDIDIRGAFDDGLRRVHGTDAGTVIRRLFDPKEERRRIDVAMINGHRSGWEIKSDTELRGPPPVDASATRRLLT